MLEAGARLGPYQILEPVGAGGMGEVYRARDPRLDRDVAIKVLPRQFADHPHALARFDREAKTLAALSHPNILAIHDVGADGNSPYVVMELLAGETLRSRLDRSALSWRNAIEVGVAVAEGLAAAHAKGITHRDLKPENIFLTADGRVKILDFGLASAVRSAESQTPDAAATVSALTQHGTVMGTVGYMSPEQVRGETIGPPSDIFSFGCVLYEILSGRRPFARPTTAETMAAILERDPAPLEPGELDRPAQLPRVVSRCLEKKSDQRFQSAHDLSFALAGLLSDRNARAPHRSRSSRTGSWIAVAVVVLLIGVGAYWVATRTPATPQAIDSIAVLPLINDTGSDDTEYLSDGIAESLINALSQLPRLRVMARTTVFRYKGRQEDPRTIGRELGVRAVFTGRVVQRANRLSIQADLIDVESGMQLWGDRYTRSAADILIVQEEIARRIAEGLRLKLTGTEQQLLARQLTTSASAYELYLKGRYYSFKFSKEGFDKGLEYLKQAVQADPNYVMAYVGMVEYYAIYTTADAAARAREAATKALALDDTLADTHYAAAVVAQMFEWNWPTAELEYQRALALGPGSAATHLWYGTYLSTVGRSDEGIHQLTLAQQLDPFSVLTITSLGRAFYFARRFDEAIAYLQRASELDSQFWMAHMFRGLALQQLRRYDEAIAEARIVEPLLPNGPAIIGQALAAAGKRAEASQVLAKLTPPHPAADSPACGVTPGCTTPWAMAMLQTALDNKDEAFRFLDKAYAVRWSFLPMVKVDPALDTLRSDPRFEDLLRRLRLAS
jgi:serine/threonine-protein kinase